MHRLQKFGMHMLSQRIDNYCNENRMVGFFEVLKFREWLIFGFFTILFSRMGLSKAHTLQWVVGFFEELNFMNDQHLRNSRNLHTSKKINYTVEESIKMQGISISNLIF